jgi:Na+-transporting NADH:ubiquinone oxidoreductase subunit NqrC
MGPDAFRILSVAIIVAMAVLTIHLMRENSIADRFIEAQKRDYAANIKAERERKLEAQRMMAGSQPQRSKDDCAKSLQAIKNKRRELLQENQRKFPKDEPINQVMFLICEKNLTWLDGSNFSGPPDFSSSKKCKPGEMHLYSMFGCPLEMIQQLPGPF